MYLPIGQNMNQVKDQARNIASLKAKLWKDVRTFLNNSESLNGVFSNLTGRIIRMMMINVVAQPIWKEIEMSKKIFIQFK